MQRSTVPPVRLTQRRKGRKLRALIDRKDAFTILYPGGDGQSALFIWREGMDNSLRVAYLNGYIQALNDYSRGANCQDLFRHANGILMTWAFRVGGDNDNPPVWTNEERAKWSE